MKNSIRVFLIIYILCCFCVTSVFAKPCKIMDEKFTLENVIYDDSSLDDEFLYYISSDGVFYGLEGEIFRESDTPKIIARNIKKSITCGSGKIYYTKRNGNVFVYGEKQPLFKNVKRFKLIRNEEAFGRLKYTVWFCMLTREGKLYHVVYETKKKKIIKKKLISKNVTSFKYRSISLEYSGPYVNIYFKKNGNLYAYGHKWGGMRGCDQKNVKFYKPNLILKNVKKIYTGVHDEYSGNSGQMFAINKNNNLYTWGPNYGGVKNKKRFINKPTLVHKRVKKFNTRTLQFIDEQDNLWGWSGTSGDHYIEYLGGGIKESQVPILIDNNVKKAGMHYCIKKDNTLWSWYVFDGENTDNSIDLENNIIPKAKLMLTNVKKSFFVDYYGMALTYKGELYFWDKKRTEPILVAKNVRDMKKGYVLFKDSSLGYFNGGDIGDSVEVEVFAKNVVDFNAKWHSKEIASESVEITYLTKNNYLIYLYQSGFIRDSRLLGEIKKD